MMKIKFAIGSTALAADVSFHAAAQDVVRPGQEKWTIMLGAFLPGFKTEMKVDNDQLGTPSTVSPAISPSERRSTASTSAST